MDKRINLELTRALLEMDLILRPIAILCNPEDEKELKEALEKEYYIKSTPLIKKGEAIICNRELTRDLRRFDL